MINQDREDTHVEIVPDNHHGRVAARALALDLDDGELSVLGGLAGLDAAEMAADGVEDVVRAAEHARCRRADLHEVLADWLPAHRVWIHNRAWREGQ